MNVWEINDPQRLAECQSDWNWLWKHTPGATLFHTFDWFQTYWRHYGRRQRLRLLIICDSQSVRGIVPLTVRTEKTRAGLVRVLTYPLHDWGSFYCPIGPDLAGTLQAALDYLRRAPRDWDLLDLRWIASSEVDRTGAAMRAAGFDAQQQPWIQTSLVDLHRTDWHTYWAGRTSRWRNNVRRSERKLAASGEVSFLRYRAEAGQSGPMDPRWDLFEQCVALAGRSWQAFSSDGTTLTHESVRDFLRDAHGMAARRGAVDVNLLSISGTPVAFAYNYAWQGWVYGVRMGYDATLTRDGAGSVLMHRMLQDSFQRGDAVFDLGADYHDAKRYWQTSAPFSYRSTHFALSAPRAQLLRVKRWLRYWLGDEAAESHSKQAAAQA